MLDNIRQILAVGENVVVEVKRCGNGIKFGTYENILDGEADVPISVPINVPINGSKKPGGYYVVKQSLIRKCAEEKNYQTKVESFLYDENEAYFYQ